MVATIIISILLVSLVGLIIYRMVKNAKSGEGGCAGCAHAGGCPAAEYMSKRSAFGCPEPKVDEEDS